MDGTATSVSTGLIGTFLSSRCKRPFMMKNVVLLLELCHLLLVAKTIVNSPRLL